MLAWKLFKSFTAIIGQFMGQTSVVLAVYLTHTVLVQWVYFTTSRWSVDAVLFD